MQSPNTLGWMALIAIMGCLPAWAEDTLGSLMQKQAQLLEVELDAKLLEKRAKLDSTEKNGAVVGPSTVAVPDLVAVYGMGSQLNAEFNYKGRIVAVSASQPVIDRADGWRVTRIQPGQTEVCRGSKKKTGCRLLALDWDAQATNALAGTTLRVPLSSSMLNAAASSQRGPMVPALDVPLASQ